MILINELYWEILIEYVECINVGMELMLFVLVMCYFEIENIIDYVLVIDMRLINYVVFIIKWN